VPRRSNFVSQLCFQKHLFKVLKDVQEHNCVTVLGVICATTQWSALVSAAFDAAPSSLLLLGGHYPPRRTTTPRPFGPFSLLGHEPLRCQTFDPELWTFDFGLLILDMERMEVGVPVPSTLFAVPDIPGRISIPDTRWCANTRSVLTATSAWPRLSSAKNRFHIGVFFLVPFVCPWILVRCKHERYQRALFSDSNNAHIVRRGGLLHPGPSGLR
jgi:hypothetical protein